MKIFEKLFSWYGKKKVLLSLIIIVVLVFLGISLKSGDDKSVLELNSETKLPLVEVGTAEKINNTEQLSLVGKVRALSEVDITPDRSGRVTKVNTSLGQSVRVGQVIIELENSSERAALLQAEGAYEIAKASSAQSDVGLREAEHDFQDVVQNAKNTNQNAYNTVNNVILGTIDLFFAAPNSTVPGLKIGGVGNTDFLNQERVAFQTILPNWNESLKFERSFEEELQNLQDVRSDVKRVLDFINILVPLLNDTRSIGGYSESEVVSLRQELTTAQTQITGTLTALDGVYTELKNAKEKLERAKISATGVNNSVSDAQLKQALGALRSAQANYEKTILRSPINGTVNEIDVKVGQFINASNPVAKIANNTKSEIVVYVNDKEKENLFVGNEVIVNDNIKGQIAVIAPAIDSVTQKTEVRIVSESDELVIGNTVRVVGYLSENLVADKKINIPLTAVKFDGNNAYIFVVENGILTRKDIELGEVRGGMVNVISGIESTTEFVIDARGFAHGDKVEILREE